MNHQRQTYFLVSSEGVPIRNIADYSPFGVQLDGRTIQGDFYRYGYQGSEKDDEAKGGGNSYTTYYRLLDPRVGRWFSIDPKMSAWESPYVSMANNPIFNIDIYGDSIRNEMKTTMGKQALNEFIKTNEGKDFLAKYAFNGQKIGDHTFTSDGEFHKKGIDLILTDFSEDDGYGSTDAGKRPSTSMGTDDIGPKAGVLNGRLKISVNLNSNMLGANNFEYRKGKEMNMYQKDPNSWKKIWNVALCYKIQTLAHELMIHALSASNDYIDDGKMNCSFSKDDHSHWFGKIGIDVNYYRNGTFTKIKSTSESIYLYGGLNIANRVHQKFQTGVSKEKILDAHTNGIRYGNGDFHSESIYKD